MPRVIGVDLGTTNTAVAVLDGGRPRVLEDERGYKVLPSVVSSKAEGRFIVGHAAHSLIITAPERTVYATKRLMGRRFDSPEVQRVLGRVQYKLRPAADGGVQMQLGDQWMTPTEVAAVILQVARGIAERQLGDVVEEAVITVPAYFNHAQRKATLEAAKIAGLPCDRLLNEPTAAALAYGHRKNIDRTILVFDLGGGTFDVSVLKLAHGIYEILASTGDTFLGGEDFDYRIVEHVADAFQARTRVDIRQDRAALQRVKDAAERAKCELSFSDRANIVIPHLVPDEGVDLVLTRSTLEGLTQDLIDQCIEIARRAVSDAGLSLSDIEEVILVGGQTRMPKVREAVAGLFGREPNRSVHPEEVVAIGAAVHASALGEAEAPRAVLLDVTPFDLGIDTAGGVFIPIIARNARIPAAETKVFATVSDNQETVRVTVRQGDNRTAVQNEFLGEFVLEGLTPAPRLQTKVDVVFRIDTNGMLHVAATEKGSGEKMQITIRNYAEHARSPNFPDAEQARAEEAVRKATGAAPAKEAAKAGKDAAKAGTARAGLIDRLLGRRNGSKVKAAQPAAPAPEPAAESVAAGLASAAVGSAAAASAAAAAAASAAGASAAAQAAAVSSSAAAPPPVPVSAAAEADPRATLLPPEPPRRPGGPTPSVISAIEAGDGDGGEDEGLAYGASDEEVESFAEVGVEALDEAEVVDDLEAGEAVVWIEPDPLLVDAADGLAAELGLAPVEEEAYDDSGAGVSMGVAGGIGGFADDDPFRNLTEATPVSRGAALHDDLFANADDLFADALGGGGPAEPARDPRRPGFDPFATIVPDDGADGWASETAGAPPLAEPEHYLGPPAPSPDEAPTPVPVEPELVDDPVPAAGAPDDELNEDLDAIFAQLEEGLPSEATDDQPGPPVGAAGASDPEADRATESTPAAAAVETDLFGSDAFTADDWSPLEPAEDLVALDLGDLEVELLPADASPPAASDDTNPFGDAEETQIDFPAPSVDETGFALMDAEGGVLGVSAAEGAGVFLTEDSGVRTDAPLANPFDSDGGTRPGAPIPRRARKPARVKLHYLDVAALATEYRENLQRGGSFIQTERPLPVGRECVFELAAPGLPGPILVPATVTFVTTAAPGQEAGMAVEYRLDRGEQERIEALLARM